MNLTRNSLLILVAATCLLGSPVWAQSGELPGFGADNRAPTGAPFSLPAGLEVGGPLVGADADGNCPGRSTETVGSGVWVAACLPVRNRMGGPVSVIFPPGLVIVAASEGFQNGLLVERTVLTVPPTSSGPGRLRDKDEQEDVVYVPLRLYCINSSKNASAPAATYRLGPVTGSRALAEVFGLMEGKDVRGDGERIEVVQEAIFDVIKNGRLTPESREALEGL